MLSSAPGLIPYSLIYRCGCREVSYVAHLPPEEKQENYFGWDCDVTVCRMCEPNLLVDGYACPNGRKKHAPLSVPLEELVKANAEVKKRKR